MRRIAFRWLLLVALAFSGCAQEGTYSLHIEFPDQAAMQMVHKLTIWAAESTVTCQQVMDGDVVEDDLAVLSRQVLYDLEQGVSPLRVPSGSVIFIVEVRNEPDVVILRGCEEAEVKGGSTVEVTLRLEWVCKPDPLGELADNLVDDDCDGLTDECIEEDPCDDEDPCTHGDVCSDAVCAGTPYSCDDENVCTTDTCNGDGTCDHLNNAADCDDGDVCTMNDTCGGGACDGVPLDADSDGYSPMSCGGSDCDDSNGAISPGVFEAADGEPPCQDGIDNDCDTLTDGDDPGCQSCTQDADCDDQNVCNGLETCQAGACVGGQALDCDDNDVCTDDSCDATDGCRNVFNSSACDDSDLCTSGDVCSAGVCSGTPYTCNDDNICTDDICLGDGTCDFVNNTAACDDGDACTHDDACSGGACAGTLLDGDSDGHPPESCGGDDCDDTNPAVNPGEIEGPSLDAACTDNLDNDCDGLTDSEDPSSCLDHFTVAGIRSPTDVGVPESVVVTAKDAYENTVTGYRGTITFASSDAGALLPPDYTFTAGDQGSHTFTDEIIFQTAGTQWVRADDGAVSGSQTGIVVDPTVWIFRSVGPGNTAALASGGAGSSLTISGSNAAFSTALPDRVGVGDVIQYDSDGDHAVDALAFVHARSSSTGYLVKSADGSAPASVTSSEDWAVFRAYTSLWDAEMGAENAGIEASLSDFDAWSDGKDLVVADQVWMIACYGDAEDYIPTVIRDWVTSPENYIKIYTPTHPAQVGTSQRHPGKWSNQAYRLVTGDSTEDSLIIRADYVRVEGIQVRNSGHDLAWNANGIWVSVSGSDADVRVSHSIFDGTGVGAVDEFRCAVYYQGSGPNSVCRMWNNIAYGWGEDGQGFRASYGDWTAYMYNNTSVGNHDAGFRCNDVCIAKNNIAIGNDGFTGTFDSSSGNNASSTGDAPGSNPIALSSNSWGDYFLAYSYFKINPQALYAGEITGAGIDLSADPFLPFADDIDGDARPASWDLGADQGGDPPVPAVHIYRSVGPGASAPLAAGFSNDMTISGSTATFSSTLPQNVGLGDVIVYDSSRGGFPDAVALIHQVTSSTEYTVKKADGSEPAAVVDCRDWSIFRAYTRLFDAERGAENDGIDVSLRDFDTWSNGKDLVTANQVWNIACYGGDPDTRGVSLDGWTTAPPYYLRVFTPVHADEVGFTQRHSGVWDPSKYHLHVESSGSSSALAIDDDFVRVDGLQIKRTGIGEAVRGSYVHDQAGGADIRISNCIYVGPDQADTTIAWGIEFLANPSATLRLWNNIFYGWDRSGGSGSGVAMYLLRGMVYAYNNLVYDSEYAFSTSDSWGTPVVVLKNNISLNNTNYDYGGDVAFDPASINNAAADGTAPGANPVTLSSSDANDYFISPTNFHIDPAATHAGEIMGAGVDLSNDPDLPFSGDIDGDARTTPWDLGPDQH